MAVKIEKVVETFYENLEKGKILGRKCPECGAVEFPPVYACNSCGCLHTEWYEISGKAKMHSIVMPAALSSKPEYKALGKYAYGESENTAYCHLYTQGDVTFQNGIELTCETGYPYEFTVRYLIKKGGRIAIRIPARCKEFQLECSGKPASFALEKGYAYLTAKDGDQITLTLKEEVRFIRPSAKIPALTGLIALMRGPLVYCFEGVDNDQDVLSLRLDPTKSVQVESFSDGLIQDSQRLLLNAYRMDDADSLYTDSEPALHPCIAAAIPYYLWGNRGETQMRVWMGRV